MTKGIVLFFEQGSPLWVQHVIWPAYGVRGWVKDGHFWIDYNKETQILNVCTPQLGVMQWDKPINTMRNMVVKSTVIVPATVEFTEPADVIAWATKEKEDHEKV